MSELIAYFFVVLLASGPTLVGPFAERETCWIDQRAAEARGWETGACALLAVSLEDQPITLTVYTQ